MANLFFSGRIPPGLADKIDAYLLTRTPSEGERVEALAEDLLDFKHMGDLERWLAV